MDTINKVIEIKEATRLMVDALQLPDLNYIYLEVVISMEDGVIVKSEHRPKG